LVFWVIPLDPSVLYLFELSNYKMKNDLAVGLLPHSLPGQKKKKNTEFSG
jgi:hypothetical protein